MYKGHKLWLNTLPWLLVAAAIAETPWYELKDRPGANYYDIAKAYQAEKTAEDAAEARDLTLLLQERPELYEMEDDFQYRRWADFVEPRVAPSGDLSLLWIGQREMVRLAGLDGAAPRPTRGAWEPLGPFAAGTAGAGRLNWIDFHPTDNNAFMVGSPGGGVWFTRDAGATWTTSTDRVANLGAAWAAYHPTNPDIIYLGTGDGFGNRDVFSVGVVKTVDGGKTWNATGLTYPVSELKQINKLIIDPKNPERVLVATNFGAQITTDGGATFKAAAGITGKVWDIEFHPTDPSIVYGSTTALFRSADGGETFARVPGVLASNRMMLAVSAAKPDYVYVLRGARTSTEGVSRSTDAGKTFTQVGTGSAIGCIQAFYDYAFDANPTNAQELAAGCLDVFRSVDGGATWSKNGSGYHVDVHSSTYRKDGALFALSDGGVWRSSGSGWTNINSNLNVGQSYRVGVHPTDYDQVCTGRQDNGTDIRAGAGGFKESPVGGDGFECFWNSDGTDWHGEYQGGGFMHCKYANGQASGCTESFPSATGVWDTPWGPDPIDPAGLYAGRAGDMWKSANHGTSWTQMGAMDGSGSIRNYVVAPSNSKVIYVMKAANVFKTSDGGTSWQNVTGTVQGTPTYGAVDAKNPNEVWVTVSGYAADSKVYHSANGGQSWINETLAGLPNLPANAVVVDDLGQNGVYVGLDVGVYYKKDGMTAWENFSEGLPNAQIRELEIGRKGKGLTDRRLFAATYGRGIMRTKLWDEVPVSTRRGFKPLVLSDLKTRMDGSILAVRFRAETDGVEGGTPSLQLTRLDGKSVYRENRVNSGIHEQRIDLGGQGKGLYLLILKNARTQVTRRILVD